MNFGEVLFRAAAASEFVESWTHHAPSDGTVMYVGDTQADQGWRFVVVKFPLPDDSGFGYDGTVVRLDLVVRLLPEIAEKVFAIASKTQA